MVEFKGNLPTVLESFESSLSSNWTVHADGWGRTTNPSGISGSYSAGMSDSNYDDYGPVAVYTADKKLRKIRVYYQESSGSHGGGLALHAEDGSIICAAGTYNPQYAKTDDADFGFVTWHNSKPDQYDVWVELTITLNPSDGKVHYKFDNGNVAEEQINNMRTEAFAKEIRFVNVSNGNDLSNQQGGGSHKHYWDQLSGEIITEISPPESLSLSKNKDGTAVTLSWDNVEKAQGYEVQQRDSHRGTSWETVGRFTSTFTTLEVPDFGQVMEYRVRAINQRPSDWVSNDIQIPESIPDKVQNVSLTHLSDDRVEVDWSWPNEPAYHTQIRFSEVVSGSADYNDEYEITPPYEKELFGMEGEIRASVRGSNAEGYQYDWAHSNTVEIWPPIEEEVQNVTIDSASGRKLTLSWDFNGIQEEVKQFELQVAYDGGGFRDLVSLPGGISDFSFTYSPPDVTQVKFRVRATNPYHETSWKMSSGFTNAAPEPPEDPSLTVNSTGNANISWEPPETAYIVDKYEIQVAEDGGSFTSVTTTTSTAYDYSSSSVRRVKFRVRASNKNGTSKWVESGEKNLKPLHIEVSQFFSTTSEGVDNKSIVYSSSSDWQSNGAPSSHVTNGKIEFSNQLPPVTDWGAYTSGELQNMFEATLKTNKSLSISVEEAGVYNIDTDYYEWHGDYHGSVLLPDGRLLYVPYNIGYPLIYNPDSETFTKGTTAGSYAEKDQEWDSAFYHGQLLPTGKVLFLPMWDYYSYIGLYDPDEDTYEKLVEMPISDEMDEPIGTILPSGDIYIAIVTRRIGGNAWYESAVIEPDAEYGNIVKERQSYNLGSDYYTNPHEPVVLFDGRVLIAMGDDPCLIHDVSTGEITEVSTGDVYAQTAQLLPDGNVIMTNSGVRIVDVSNEEIATSFPDPGGEAKWPFVAPNGDVLLLDGTGGLLWRVNPDKATGNYASDNTSLEQLTEIPEHSFLTVPQMLPDGSLVAFDMWTGTTDTQQLYRIHTGVEWPSSEFAARSIFQRSAYVW
jgi:hypothetical protein